MTTSTATVNATACVEFADLFLHPLLEDHSGASSQERREQAMMQRQAANLCAECPLRSKCLYDAVVNFDVSGFVAGTTARQRVEIRQRLGVRVQAEDLDTLAGVTASNRQVDHHEVVRMRKANPNETLDRIASRLGCSLSTVKRHLRKSRAESQTPKVEAAKPTEAQVQAALDALSAPRRPERRAA